MDELIEKVQNTLEERNICIPDGYDIKNVLVDYDSIDITDNYLKEFAIRADKKKQLQTIGPASPYVGKVNDVYRKIFYIKGEEDKHLCIIRSI